jgi:hypothetical protein
LRKAPLPRLPISLPNSSITFSYCQSIVAYVERSQRRPADGDGAACAVLALGCAPPQAIASQPATQIAIEQWPTPLMREACAGARKNTDRCRKSALRRARG